MKKVIIYPGRFQPMLSHHAEVLRQLQTQYPDADVYVGTSDKVDGEKSPFNFAEKQQIAQAHGIKPNRVLQANRPYNKDEYPFDQDNTVIIFAVGEKDMNRFPFSNIDSESGLDMTVRGEPKPKYFQKIDTIQAGALPMSQRGYITLAPTIRTGNQVASASEFRQQFKSAPDREAAKQLFTKQFGEYNENVFNLIYNKIVGTNMSESINILRQLAGLPVEESAPVNFGGSEPKSSISKEEQALADIGRLVMAGAKTIEDPEVSNKVASFGMKLTAGDITTHSHLINAIKDAGEHAGALSNAVKQAMADMQAGNTVRDADRDVPAPDYDKAKADYRAQKTEQVDLSDFYEEDEDNRSSAFVALAQAANQFQNALEKFEVTENNLGEQAAQAVGSVSAQIDELLRELSYEFEESTVNEAEGSDVADACARFEELANEEGYYGDCDALRIQELVDAGDVRGAAEEMANSITDQDGGEAPDHFVDYALETLGEFSESTVNEEEVGSHPCHVCGNMSYADGTCSDRTCSNFDQPVEIDETVEAVESTSNNAMAAAMAELHKLAGI